MTQLTINLSMDVPEGYLVILRPKADGGYSLRLQAEERRVLRPMTQVALPMDLPAQPAPKRRKPRPYMKKGGAAALDICNDLTALGEPITNHSFAALAGCSQKQATVKLQNLRNHKHLKIMNTSTRGVRNKTNIYSLA